MLCIACVSHKIAKRCDVKKQQVNRGTAGVASRGHETVQGTYANSREIQHLEQNRKPRSRRNVARRRKDRYAHRELEPASRPTSHRARLRLQLTQQPRRLDPRPAPHPSQAHSAHTPTRVTSTRIVGGTEGEARGGGAGLGQHRRAEESMVCNHRNNRTRIVESGIGT